jgi:hypothetical protein
MENTDVKDGAIVGPTLLHRLDMLARDVRVYGSLLAHQRKLDLAGEDSCFMGRHRK